MLKGFHDPIMLYYPLWFQEGWFTSSKPELPELKPSEIAFSKQFIKKKFADGTKLQDLVMDLIEQESLIEHLDPLELTKVGDIYMVVNGNRRLFVLKKLEEHGFPFTHPIPICLYTGSKPVPSKPWMDAKMINPDWFDDIDELIEDHCMLYNVPLPSDSPTTDSKTEGEMACLARLARRTRTSNGVSSNVNRKLSVR